MIEEGNLHGWEWVAMSQHGSRYLAELEEGQERDLIQTIMAGIEEGTGKRPKGWITPCFAESFQTPDILAEAGLEYLCDYTCDDQPFPLHVRSGTLLSMPYSIEINDMTAFLAIGVSGTEFGKMMTNSMYFIARAQPMAVFSPFAFTPFLSVSHFAPSISMRLWSIFAGMTMYGLRRQAKSMNGIERTTSEREV